MVDDHLTQCRVVASLRPYQEWSRSCPHSARAERSYEAHLQEERNVCEHEHVYRKWTHAFICMVARNMSIANGARTCLSQWDALALLCCAEYYRNNIGLALLRVPSQTVPLSLPDWP